MLYCNVTYTELGSGVRGEWSVGRHVMWCHSFRFRMLSTLLSSACFLLSNEFSLLMIFALHFFPTLVLVLENFHEIDFLLPVKTVFVSLLPSPALLIDRVSCQWLCACRFSSRCGHSRSICRRWTTSCQHRPDTRTAHCPWRTSCTHLLKWRQCRATTSSCTTSRCPPICTCRWDEDPHQTPIAVPSVYSRMNFPRVTRCWPSRLVLELNAKVNRHLIGAFQKPPGSFASRKVN